MSQEGLFRGLIHHLLCIHYKIFPSGVQGSYVLTSKLTVLVNHGLMMICVYGDDIMIGHVTTG